MTFLPPNQQRQSTEDFTTCYHDERNCTQTSFVRADFGDAKFFGRRVYTLNDDVLEFTGCSARHVNHSAGSNSDRHRSTDCVRVHVDCVTSRWQGD